MRILYVDTAIDGHHMPYLNGLLSITKFTKNTVALVGPYNNYSFDSFSNIVLYKYNLNLKKKSYSAYKKWINFIKNVAYKENVDLVHFLDGDTIMRFFGSGINQIKAKKIITYHHFFNGFIRKLSYKRMAKSVDQTVVHLDNFANKFHLYGINNVSVINYPSFQFETLNSLNPNDCKENFRLPFDKIIISIIGATSTYKGYNDLIKVLSKGNFDYLHLFIVGREGEIGKNQFENLLTTIGCSYTLEIREINDCEYAKAIVASDIIILPYVAGFEGASGPLSDGASCKKTIIASTYSGLGNIVYSNALGYKFSNLDELLELFKNKKDLLSHTYKEKANFFRENLSPKKFLYNYLEIYSKILKQDEKDNCEIKK